MTKLLVLLALLLHAPLAGFAADPEPPKKDDSKKEDDKKEKDPFKEEQTKVTKHSVTIGGQRVDYTATAGTILLRNAKNEPTASIFYIAYTRDGVGKLEERPVTFSFNGGPGSASVWLHMGVLGPKRVVLEEDGSPVPPPYRLVGNEFSLLDETDLVFIDPVSTGYSRAAKPDEARNFHGVEADIRSVAEFIRLYASRHQRWTSPKFIIGESYGTTRAAGLSGELSDRHRMNVNGIMLVSTVLNFGTILFSEGNDLPYLLYLPSYTATAWYHKKLAPELQDRPLREVLGMAEEFALGDYNRALATGDALRPDKRREIVATFARFTGLDPAFVERSDLRVNLGGFTRELLRAGDRQVGRFDSRYTGPVRNRTGLGMEYDPSGEAIFSAYASTFNQYIRAELGFESDLPYEILTPAVQPWNWGEENRYLNVSGTLASSLTRNRFLKVYVASGYYDMATPYFAADYTFNHLGVAPEVLRNVRHEYYHAGHMMYLNLPDLKKQKEDLARFIREAAFQRN